MSRKRIVQFRGKLTGNGQDADCTVEALEVENPSGGPPAHSQFSTIKVSRRLPEGAYELTTGGEIYQVRFANGFWLGAF